MTIGEEIVKCIKANEGEIRKHLQISQGQWKDGETAMIPSINNINELKDIRENYLTFILSCAHAIEGHDKIHSLQQILCNCKISASEKYPNPIWFQYSPYAVGKEKGKGRPGYSKFEMAFGDINLCEGKESYIEYCPKDIHNGWICFVEMKTDKDISGGSTDNPNYNQLAKYIKVALSFQKFGRFLNGKFPSEIYICLITPKKFFDNPHSRLYGYKFEEYTSKNKIEYIKKDIPPKINHEYFNEDWIDPMQQSDIDNRIASLKLNWITCEMLFDNISDDNPLKQFIDQIRQANKHIFEQRAK